MSSPLKILFALLLLFTATATQANTVTFDFEPLGSTYGVPAGHTPGDWIMAEDSADLRVDDFFIAGVPYFNFSRIELPFMGFGSGQILDLNNVTVHTDFAAPGDASFLFLDLGGSVNIQVNGFGAVIEAPDFPSLGTFSPAPGVVMSTTWVPVGGGIMGTVTLTGPVQHVRIGGQELWIDDLVCNNGLGGAAGPCLYAVDYETLPMGNTYGTPAGHSPGDWAFNEGGIDVYVVDFDAGGIILFNEMIVVPGFGPLGPIKVMNVNNIGQLFDLAPLGITTTEVSFEYIDFGGTENLAINGSVLQIGDLHTFSGMTLGGVYVSVVTWPYGAGVYGRVTLTGNVQTLRVGGQEFWMDDVCVKGAPIAPCDRLVDHETRLIGEAWGSPFGDAPGDLLFVEDGIPVYIGEYQAGTGGWFYNYCEITNALLGFGTANVMLINNVVNLYDIAATGLISNTVTFEYLDLGGTENLEVNGAPRYVGELDLAPVNIAPGVTCSVVTWAVPGGKRGEVTLTGQVDKLVVGGQEFWIDNICVKAASSGGPVMWCDHLSDIESPAMGSAWGGSYGNTPGDHIFTEDMMDVMIFNHTDPTGLTFFGDARVDAAFAPFGTSQILTMSSVGIGYDLAALGTVEKVRFEYFDGSGIENLIVNGAPIYIGEIDAAPATIAPGITCTVYEIVGPGFEYGTVVLEGNVQTFMIAGQQFAIDNVCVRLAGSTTDVNVMPRADVSLEPNYPNPFNPSTMLQFNLGHDSPVRLTIHDVAGRVVRTLINEQRSGGSHSVVWNGQLDSGATASAGVYFVRVESREGVDTQKIALIK
jgi:hypothetical protein